MDTFFFKHPEKLTRKQDNEQNLQNNGKRNSTMDDYTKIAARERERKVSSNVM